MSHTHAHHTHMHTMYTQGNSRIKQSEVILINHIFLEKMLVVRILDTAPCSFSKIVIATQEL